MGDTMEESIDSSGDQALSLDLTQSTHTAIGVFLTVSGLIGLLANVIVLVTFWRSLSSKLSPASIVLVNLTFSDVGILLMGFPFNATSHLAGRWLYGAIGCQVYGFCCFLFGTAHIGALSLLAYEQYRTISRMRPDAAPSQRYLDRLQRTYIFYGIVIWMFAFIWATPPLFGWSRYSLEPFGTACTIDWRQNTFEYKAYVVAYFIGGYLLPFTLIIFSFRRMVVIKRIYKQEFARRSIECRDKPTIIDSLKEQREEDLTMTCLLIVSSFLTTWTPYAVLCLWSVIWGPDTVPSLLMIGPNICAKASGALNPFIYSFSNRNLRSGISDTLRAIFPSMRREEHYPRDRNRGATKRTNENVGLAVLSVSHHQDSPVHY
ncbi:visual pigment receptor peropsin-like [Tropilaelaps mercedesae]|uniref:Visual pigment receptor peropsin-like n=1 Tax=Tropilaelaps mercedesae TaxID=418985 RepID=A0A1V9XRA4_9ACAR|nr:visual pigment receptor peropsin-like [Tropilaelaps mercedesae]